METQRTQVPHPHPIRAGDEGVVRASIRAVSVTHHLSSIVDAISSAAGLTQRAQVSHAHSIRAGDEGVSPGLPDHLPSTVDAISIPGAITQFSHPHPIQAGDEGMSPGLSDHLAGIIDAISNAGIPIQRAQVGCCPAIEVNEICSLGLLCRGVAAKTQAHKKGREEEAAEVESKSSIRDDLLRFLRFSKEWKCRTVRINKIIGCLSGKQHRLQSKPAQ
jgi:hypothetical protein